MKLNSQQLGQIKAFISKRGFTYPDVQLEIIDHVASRVEELLEVTPRLNLDQAINITHGEFGIMGFSVFEDSMIAFLQKKFFRLFLSTFSSFFNWKYLPAIGISVYIIQRLYVAINAPEMFVIVGCGAFLLTLLLIGMHTAIKYKKYSKLLTMKMGNSYLIIFSIIYNVWNIFGVQLKLYQRTDLQTAGIIYGTLITLVTLLFLTVETIRRESVTACIELDEKYQLLKS